MIIIPTELVFWKGPLVFWKGLLVFWKGLLVFWKGPLVFWKALLVFWKGLLVFWFIGIMNIGILNVGISNPFQKSGPYLILVIFFTDNILGSKIFTQNIEIIAHLHPLCAVIFWISKLVEWLLELLRLKLDMFNFNLRKSESHCMYVILLKSRFRLYSSSKLFPQFLSEFHRFPIWHMSGWKALCQKKSR